MIFGIMVLQIVFIIEVFLTALAIMVIVAFDVVVCQIRRGFEVDVAIVTDIVTTGVVDMLLKCSIGTEVTFTTVAVGHNEYLLR